MLPLDARAASRKETVASQVAAAESKVLSISSARSCSEIDQLIAVDREALTFERSKAKVLAEDKSDDQGRIKFVESAEKALNAQMETLLEEQKLKGCFGKVNKRTDAAVYARADAGSLKVARAIERAKRGQLVDGSSATCMELTEILKLDQRAIQFEKAKLEAQVAISPKSPQTRQDEKMVRQVEKQFEKQAERLEGLFEEKQCSVPLSQLPMKL